jgi:hypothetical protein
MRHAEEEAWYRAVDSIVVGVSERRGLRTFVFLGARLKESSIDFMYGRLLLRCQHGKRL